MSLHLLRNIEIQKYYQNESKFNGVYSKDNSPNKIKDGEYIINLDEYADISIRWIALYCKNIGIIYFDMNIFLKNLKEFVGKKNLKINIFRIHSNNSVMCGCFYIGVLICSFQAKLYWFYQFVFAFRF